jgi:CBS domain-containing protein
MKRAKLADGGAFMSVKGLMTTLNETMTKSTTVSEACRVMNREKVGALAVVEEGKLSGIFTYRDLVDRVILEKRDPETTKLEEVMTTEVETLRVDGRYGDALRVMVDKDYTYVPILGEEGKFAGMLSLRGLLEHKIDHLANELDAVTQYLTVDGPGGD